MLDLADSRKHKYDGELTKKSKFPFFGHRPCYSTEMDLSQLVTEAASIEQSAMSADRDSRVSDAITLYGQAVMKLSSALSLCPYNDPDALAIEKHVDEIQNRISYLSTLSATAKPAIPLESHIHAVQLSIPVSPTNATGPSSTKTMGAAAAIGGVGGLLLLGPIGLIAGAAGAAYATTRSDAIGSSSRGVARGSIAAIDSVTTANRDHGITEKAKQMGSAAISKATEINEQYQVTATVKTVGSHAYKKLSTFNEEYKVTDKIASGIAAGFSTISNFLQPTQQPTVTSQPHQQFSDFN